MAKIHSELIVKVWDAEGRLIATRRKVSDLLLLNFLRRIQVEQLYRADSLALTEEGGASYTFADTHNLTDNKIAVGTGTTAPARTDYALESKVAETTAVTVTEIDYATVTAAASITLTTAADITEAGFFFYSATDAKWFMMIRDTFPAVSVPAGGTISITFKIEI